MKRVLLFIGLLSLTFSAFTQEEFTQYTQKINGTALSFEMAPIPGGEFIMGNNDGEADQKPEHPVKISPFWMSVHEVTWDLYEPFQHRDLELNISENNTIPEGVDAVTRPTKSYIDMSYGMGKKGKPAMAMTNYSAIQYCKWLYARTGVFYRLPTEAEWEYVAKEGFTAEDLENMEDLGWFDENSDFETQKVGTKKPNKFGIYDILGNISEWTYDRYDPDFYKQSADKTAVNPINLPVSLYPQSVRGGSYMDEMQDISPTARGYSEPNWKELDPQIPKSDWWLTSAFFVGIRLVRPLDPPSHEEIMAYYDKAPIKDL